MPRATPRPHCEKNLGRELPLRNGRATVRTESSGVNERTSSTSGTDLQNASSLAGVRTVSRASGRPCLKASGAPAHDGVAEPVRRANDEAKGIQLRRIGTWRQVDPALLSRDEKVRPWRFQRLCTQDQFAGDRRICCSSAELISAVSCSGLPGS